MVALLWMCSRSGRVGSGVGYSDIFIHLYVCSGQFFGFKILNFNIFGVFRKTNIFFWYEDFVDIYIYIYIFFFFFFWGGGGGSSQNWTVLRGHFYAFYGLFFMPRYDFLITVKATPHECVIRTGQP